MGRRRLQRTTRRDSAPRSRGQELRPDQSPSASAPERGERARNRTKSKVRAKVEHVFLVIKRIFGWAKVRYRGLAKNTHWLFISCGLANLYVARRRLLAGA